MSGDYQRAIDILSKHTLPTLITGYDSYLLGPVKCELNRRIDRDDWVIYMYGQKLPLTSKQTLHFNTFDLTFTKDVLVTGFLKAAEKLKYRARNHFVRRKFLLSRKCKKSR